MTRLTTFCRYVMIVIWTFYCCVRRGMTRTQSVFIDCMPTECELLNVRDRASSIICRLITAESLLRFQITLVYNWWLLEVVALFENISGQITSNQPSCVVLLIYRPGSQSICSAFFDEQLSDVLQHLTVLNVPVIVAGDVNIHLERTDDTNSQRFTELLTSFGLQSRVQTATQYHGRWLDIIATSRDLTSPVIEVIDPGFSDHRLLQWTSRLDRPASIYRQVTFRPWHSIDSTDFVDILCRSTLVAGSFGSCDGDVTGNSMSTKYITKLSTIADILAPQRPVTIHPRRSDPWFDTECRAAARICRQPEWRACRLAADHNSVAAWRSQLWEYRDLLDRKRIVYHYYYYLTCQFVTNKRRIYIAFWSVPVEALQHNPRRMWRVIDDLLGWVDCVTGTASLTAEHFFQFFNAMVSGVRAVTATAPMPMFSVAPTSCWASWTVRWDQRAGSHQSGDVTEQQTVSLPRYQLGYSKKTLNM